MRDKQYINSDHLTNFSDALHTKLCFYWAVSDLCSAQAQVLTGTLLSEVQRWQWRHGCGAESSEDVPARSCHSGRPVPLTDGEQLAAQGPWDNPFHMADAVAELCHSRHVLTTN